LTSALALATIGIPMIASRRDSKVSSRVASAFGFKAALEALPLHGLTTFRRFHQ
jgi:hypothetical protein